jgi:hypothetical protein
MKKGRPYKRRPFLIHLRWSALGFYVLNKIARTLGARICVSSNYRYSMRLLKIVSSRYYDYNTV